MVSVQVGDVPAQAPARLANVLPAGGVAVSVTVVPCVNALEVETRNRGTAEQKREARTAEAPAYERASTCDTLARTWMENAVAHRGIRFRKTSRRK